MDEQELVEKDLGHGETAEAVAASARRLFPLVSPQQARNLAACGVRPVRDRTGA